jgi:hypothetical protein
MRSRTGEWVIGDKAWGPNIHQAFIDLSRRRHLFRGKRCACFYLRIFAYHHQDFRIQRVVSLVVPPCAVANGSSAANARAQLLTVPPYAVTSLIITISSWSSDRLLSRGLFIIASSATGGIGYVSVPFQNMRCHLVPIPDYAVTGCYSQSPMIIKCGTSRRSVL